VSCNLPLQAFRTPGGEVLLGRCPGDSVPLLLPCQKCMGCAKEYKRGWTLRLTHESKLWDSNLYLTLTYSDKELKSPSLVYPNFQGFMKRLRRRLSGVSVGPDGRKPIRFFCCGEYGERNKRPHFHAILFNCMFPDLKPLQNNTSRSDLCEELWGYGNVVIGTVTPASMAYVAGYTNKKHLGRRAAETYEDVVDLRTGEIHSRRREFVQMSRSPGIGASWFDRFKSDVFPNDGIVVEGGQKYKVPRYYWERFRRSVGESSQAVEDIAYGRHLRAQNDKARAERTPERRAVREEIEIRKYNDRKARNVGE